MERYMPSEISVFMSKLSSFFAGEKELQKQYLLTLQGYFCLFVCFLHTLLTYSNSSRKELRDKGEATYLALFSLISCGKYYGKINVGKDGPVFHSEFNFGIQLI